MYVFSLNTITSMSKSISYPSPSNSPIPYRVPIQLLQKLSRSSIPDIHASVQTTRDQNNVVGVPSHSNHSSVVLKLLADTVGGNVVDDHLGVHTSRSHPVELGVEGNARDQSMKRWKE